MPSIARPSLSNVSAFDPPTLLASFSGAARSHLRGGGRVAGSAEATARAVASVGIGALVGLPALMLVALVFKMPLVAPAAIACGYLAIAHSLATQRMRRAAFATGALLASLVGWLIVHLLSGDAALSEAGLTAAAMAPLLAAAPAFARRMLQPRGTEAAAPDACADALKSVRCLDEHAPSEAVVLTDGDGFLLAATRAARARLLLVPGSAGRPLEELFNRADASHVREAAKRCRDTGETAVLLRNDERWMLSPCGRGGLSLRLTAEVIKKDRLVAPPMREAVEPAEAAEPAAAVAPATPACDLAEATEFALRRARQAAQAKGISLTRTIEPRAAIACERQAGRRILHLAIQEALADASSGSRICVDGRRLRGIVLIRITNDPVTVGDDESALAMLRSLVEDAGGTLLVERQNGSQILSIRVEAADPLEEPAMEKVSDRADAR